MPPSRAAQSPATHREPPVASQAPRPPRSPSVRARLTGILPRSSSRPSGPQAQSGRGPWCQRSRSPASDTAAACSYPVGPAGCTGCHGSAKASTGRMWLGGVGQRARRVRAAGRRVRPGAAASAEFPCRASHSAARSLRLGHCSGSPPRCARPDSGASRMAVLEAHHASSIMPVSTRLDVLAQWCAERKLPSHRGPGPALGHRPHRVRLPGGRRAPRPPVRSPALRQQRDHLRFVASARSPRRCGPASSPSAACVVTYMSRDVHGQRPGACSAVRPDPSVGDLRHCRAIRPRRSDAVVTAEAGLSTRWPVVAKDPATFTVPPNLTDYDATCATFTWDQAPGRWTGCPGVA